MKLHAIICKVLSRETFHTAAHSPHVVSVSMMDSTLHDEPDKLRRAIQEEIDKASEPALGIDYILLSYGLCSRGTADLEARNVPVIIPRAHDCITLLMGSKERYQEEFIGHPGTYYYSSGWIEHKNGELRQEGWESGIDNLYEEKLKEYTEKYGEDNAKFLLEQESQWLNNYNRTALITMPFGDTEQYRQFTKDIADTHGWKYDEIKGDARLFDTLFGGVWPEEDFLIVKPGQRTSEDVNNGIISAG